MNIDKQITVCAIKPQAGGAITGTYISLKNVVKCFVKVLINQAAANTVAITIEQATAVAPTGSTAITNVAQIWSNLDCTASNTFVLRTAAVSYTTDAGQVPKIVVFQIDPASLDDGYDCITVKTGASSASNITAAWYELEMKYSGADVIAD
jgi:hypothetical protein